jgi:hypothetical protein
MTYQTVVKLSDRRLLGRERLIGLTGIMSKTPVDPGHMHTDHHVVTHTLAVTYEHRMPRAAKPTVERSSN